MPQSDCLGRSASFSQHQPDRDIDLAKSARVRCGNLAVKRDGTASTPGRTARNTYADSRSNAAVLTNSPHSFAAVIIARAAYAAVSLPRCLVASAIGLALAVGLVVLGRFSCVMAGALCLINDYVGCDSPASYCFAALVRCILSLSPSAFRDVEEK